MQGILGKAALVACLVVQPLAGIAQGIITWKDNVKGWTIAVDQTIGGGCFMYTDYEGGAVLRVQINPDQGVLQFIVGDVDWRSIEDGKLYPIEIQFGKLPSWQGDGEGFIWGDDGIRSLLLNVPFEDDTATSFIDEFQRQLSVRVRFEGNEIAHLSLRGTFAAMQEVINCQVAMFDASESSNSADPFSGSGSQADDPFK